MKRRKSIRLMDSKMILNEYGKVVEKCWLEIPLHFQNTKLDEFIIMPNHIHGIIRIVDDNNVGARHAVPLQKYEQFGKPVPGSIPTIIRSFKSAVTKRINQIRNTPGFPVWQRNYYEHIIRNETELNKIREYIINKPLKWQYNEYYL